MKIKRIAAIILVFSFLSAMVTVAKAEEPEPEPTTSAVQEETTDITEPTTAPEEDSTETADEVVAEMSVCMRTTGFPAYFHVWIYIHNVSDETLMVGPYELPAGEGVSVGSWGMSVLDWWGVYYNIEAYASRDRDANDYYVLTKEINLQEFETVSEEVAKWNYWDPIFNCTAFVYRVWNCVEGSRLFPLPLPWITLLQLAIYGAETGTLEMFVPEEERVYKQVGWGDDATLENVEKRSIDSFGAAFNGEKTADRPDVTF